MAPKVHKRGLRQRSSPKIDSIEAEAASRATEAWKKAFDVVKIIKAVNSFSLKKKDNEGAAPATPTTPATPETPETPTTPATPETPTTPATPTTPGFTFANRSHWPIFRQILHDIGKAPPNTGGNGELESETDVALASFHDLVQRVHDTLVARVDTPQEEAFLEDTFVTPELRGCIFVGHTATDLDSIAGAIGAAALFGGIAAKSEAELNGEITYALREVAQMDEPPLYDDIPGASKPEVDESGAEKWHWICLVDHNEEKQMVESLRNDKTRRKRIVGLIDHHCVASSFSTDGPLMIDVRPWGSMSSIVAHMYVRNNLLMEPSVARVLMCAILSDTLNLQSVTTTNADRFAVALLAKVGGVEDPDEVARLMFRAKTNWVVGLGPYAMVRGDQKDFTVEDWKFGIAVLEVAGMVDQVLAVADELILELRALKVEKGGGDRKKELDFAFLFIVNVVKQCSVLLVCGGREYALAQKAFPGVPFATAKAGMPAPGNTISADQTLCDVGPLVSRKAQFVPAFSRVLNEGFTCGKPRVSSDEYTDEVEGDLDRSLRRALTEGTADVTLDESQNYHRDCGALGQAVFDDPDWQPTSALNP
uniref:inorganic diphosphatase n=1 Tax=Eutreptiella gymnastica TaxID=73025 RepID=A0A7S4LJI6_9EUGL|eukprot:CAMPEP_0174301340 /NCGR_PEP_ID=MMETSP0809-20121228/58991_1 /TAXON_ID=73025 ORGANISM="Eutreptiella gymnastica-like, Strain CCMP1594" /NCGR_SAMPLE_ID=MMETSP0809 /ASSEMBLY_ACC=CAM_ASM_000658 /LENGTH=592 /DNA_ID=CAMNT_0015407079 /DNA_START=28 /DNA_END=1806 /DNA_ORIENTATION=-